MLLANQVTTPMCSYHGIYYGPYESTNHFNGDHTYTPWTYGVSGEATRTYYGNNLPPDLVLTNKILAGMLINPGGLHVDINTTAGSDHFSAIHFSPLLGGSDIEVSILDHEGSHNIVTTDQNLIVVCITGGIMISDKRLKSMQFAQIKSNIKLELLSKSICAIVKYK